MGKGKIGTSRLRALAFLAALSFYPLPFTVSPLSPPARAESTLVSTATREGRLAVFDDAWSRINERYYDRKFHGLDWDAQRTNFRALAAEVNSSQEFYAVLRRMIGSLNDPHTRIFAPEEKFDWWRPRFVSTGLGTAEVEGLPTVIQVERRSAPQRAGVRVGDVIVTVDGEAAMSLVRNRLADLPGPAGASARFRVFAKLLDGPVETPVEIVWRGKDGKQNTGRFERHWEQREFGLRGAREKTIALIEIGAFTRSIAYAFNGALPQKLAGARGVIIDLRNNGGGDAEAMADVASAFLGEKVALGQFTDRFGAGFEISTRSKSPFMPERIAQTKLPLIVLTSPRTASASEIFVAALKASRRAIVIGTETCGCVLAVRTRHSLPDGGLLDISELDYQTPAGVHLEGRGIKPDETVVIERGDLYSGRDRALDLAIGKLTKVVASAH
jgi:carboxyl-terminal processing protease